MRGSKWLASLVLLTALAACSGQAPAGSTPAADAPTEALAPAPTSVEATVAPAETAGVAIEPTAGDPDAIPTGSSALHASDPTTASLTGDKPRLVEFFAFW